MAADVVAHDPALGVTCSRSVGTSPFAIRAVLPRFLALSLFATAMGYLEAAAVLYLRTLYGGIDPVGPRNSPMTVVPDFGAIEIGREAATLVMLAAVGWLTGPPRARLGAFMAAFGIWDISYYVFLWLFTGWPSSPFAPDVLFLIPLVWWGPVVAPALIAALMTVGGGLAMARALGDGLPTPHPVVWPMLGSGAVLCLTAFMLDSIRALDGGLAAAFEVRAGPFPWPIYAVGLVVMSIGTFLAVAQPTSAATGPP